MESGPLLHAGITQRILRAYVDVDDDLKPGLLVSVHASAFEIALRDLGVPAEREAAVEVLFRGAPAGRCRADFLVERAVIVELKAVQRLDEVHTAQLVNYLRASALEVGLLLNFGPAPEIRRLIVQNARRSIRGHPRRSAVPPQSMGDDET